MPWIDWKVYRMFLWIVLSLGFLTTVTLCSTTQPATAKFFVLECMIERPTLEEDKVRSHQLMNPTTGETWVINSYDTNHDGKIDAETMKYVGGPWYPSGGTDYAEYYLFDRDYDGLHDIVYHDALQNGSCWGVNVAWNKGMGVPLREWLSNHVWHYPPDKEA